MLYSTEELSAYPRDLASLGFLEDKRRLENLINGRNLTNNENDMWLTTFQNNDHPTIKIKFLHPDRVVGIRIYNYNQCSDHVNRGVKEVMKIFAPAYNDNRSLTD